MAQYGSTGLSRVGGDDQVVCAAGRTGSADVGEQAPVVSRLLPACSQGHRRRMLSPRVPWRVGLPGPPHPPSRCRRGTRRQIPGQRQVRRHPMTSGPWFRVRRRSGCWCRGSGVGPRIAHLRGNHGDGLCDGLAEFIVRGGMSASAARKSAPVRRWAGPISATGWLPRTMVIVSPRSTASSRSEKCRDASVAVMVFIRPFYLIIRFTTRVMVHGGFHRQVPRRQSSGTCRCRSVRRGAPCATATGR